MNLKDNLRGLVPRGLWHLAGFCKRLPVYWKLDRSENLRTRTGVEGLPLFVTPEVCVHIPESVTAYINWRSHGLEDPNSSVETSDFLELAKGCKAMIDIGAQSGFMSALFARSRSGAVYILSVEPDPQVHDALARARELNCRTGVDWTIQHEAVSNVATTISVPISNSLHESGNFGSQLGKLIQVPACTLEALVESLRWAPDLLKIDVESFEHEILTSSPAILEKLKPALQLEVHWEILRQRGVDAHELLKILADLGYRGIRSRYRGSKQWERASRAEPVSRLSLCAD